MDQFQDPMYQWIEAMLAQQGAGKITPMNMGPGNSPQLAAQVQGGLNPSLDVQGLATGAETMQSLPLANKPFQSKDPAGDAAFMREAQKDPNPPAPKSGPLTMEPKSQNVIEKKKKTDLSALLPLLKAALGGSSQPRMNPGSVNVGHASGAINPSIPVLASLPLPGVNLRERFSRGRT